MGRKKKKLKNKEIDGEESKKGSRLSPETQNSVFAISCFVLVVLTILSFIDKGGRAGDLFNNFSHILFGWGFFIIPIAFLLLGISFLKFYSRESKAPSILGVGIFVLAVLGIFFIIGNDQIFQNRVSQSGYLGVIFGYPLLNLFGFASSLIILLAAIFISFLVLMDIPLHRLIFKEKEENEEETEENLNEDNLVIKHGGNGVKQAFEAKAIKMEKGNGPSFTKATEGEEEEEPEF